MKCRACLAIVGLFLFDAAQTGSAGKTNKTVSTNNQPEEAAVIRRSKKVPPNYSRKMKEDRMKDIAVAVLRQQVENLETLRYSCKADYYYDKNTQNCEDCINLCTKFDPKMCQVNCPGTYIALKFDLPYLSGSLEGLRDADHDADERSKELYARVTGLQKQVDDLQLQSTVTLCLSVALLVFAIAALLLLAYWNSPSRKKKSQNISSSDSKNGSTKSLGGRSGEEESLVGSKTDMMTIQQPGHGDVEAPPPPFSALQDSPPSKFSNVCPVEDRADETAKVVSQPEQHFQTAAARDGTTVPK